MAEVAPQKQEQEISAWNGDYNMAEICPINVTLFAMHWKHSKKLLSTYSCRLFKKKRSLH